MAKRRRPVAQATIQCVPAHRAESRATWIAPICPSSRHPELLRIQRQPLHQLAASQPSLPLVLLTLQHEREIIKSSAGVADLKGALAVVEPDHPRDIPGDAWFAQRNATADQDKARV